jgi:endogenous inhibitor of DNA gyrase (YacG/DUF329 family)
MDNIFTCSKCGQPFSSNWPSSVRHRLRKNGKIFCSKSCAAITHGAWAVNDQFNSEYRSWQAMKSRCNCKGNTHYERYGKKEGRKWGEDKKVTTTGLTLLTRK